MKTYMRARSAAAGLSLCILAASFHARADEGPATAPDVRKTTYTYKKVGDVEIKVDVFRTDDAAVRPVVLWIHGGACIMGSRSGFHGRFRDVLVEAGYAFASIDYRLAPETKLPGIYEDISDAYAWLRKEGPRLFGVDPDRVVVMGSSAGGFLTLSSGFLFKPAPRALVSFWGYGDIAGPWYSRPDPFYLRQPRVSEEDARAAVGDGVVTDSVGKPGRGKFYLYCRQTGTWPLEVTGRNPDKEPRAFDGFCPVRNVSKDYPPTLLVHGDKDTDVPFHLSASMAKELEKKGVRHDLIRIEGGGHGFGGRKQEEIEAIYTRVRDFIAPFAAGSSK